MIQHNLIGAGLCGLCLLHAASVLAQPSASEQVTRIADEYVAQYVRAFPESAELAGLPVTGHDGLSDNSLSALARWRALEDGWARRLERVEPAAVSGEPAWWTLGFLTEALQAGRGLRVCRNELWPVSQYGWQWFLVQLADAQPVGSDAARAQALHRWSQLPRYLDHEVVNLREGLRAGYTTPRRNVELTLTQLDALLAEPLEHWPFYGIARRDGSPRFVKQWTSLLRQQLKPAIERYRAFLRDEYVRRTRTAFPITANRDGAACYAASFRYFTTISRSAQQTFELGRREVEHNREQALAIGRETLGTADLSALQQRILHDPANHFTSREELLAFASAAVERAHGRLPRWFSRMPAAALRVEPYAEMLEAGSTDSYFPAAADGSSPATYRITLHQFASTTRSIAEITAFHEAYPGHHVQTAYPQPASAAHPIGTLVQSAGFTEGWARYAEALAEEMGLYQSPYARAQRRLWPARGMMLDPGVHLFGWTREQAIAFMQESGHFAGNEASELFDRIVIWPGQLTAYDTGALEVFALRRAAQEALGARFDLQQFHDVLLSSGNLTLPMLRHKVERWIAELHP